MPESRNGAPEISAAKNSLCPAVMYPNTEKASPIIVSITPPVITFFHPIMILTIPSKTKRKIIVPSLNSYGFPSTNISAYAVKPRASTQKAPHPKLNHLAIEITRFGFFLTLFIIVLNKVFFLGYQRNIRFK